MPLFDFVRALVTRLSPLGWGAILRRHGLDLDATDLEFELTRTIQPDFSAPGFEDLTPNSPKGVQSGEPHRSVLYHALASPRVRLTDAAMDRVENYPTLEELDTLENYIYSRQPPKEEQLLGLEIAVFAYEYRAASATTHRRHADLDKGTA